ncbi:MAG TPA: acyltransferase family protein [Gemmataceae bacterium]|jgi:peptidoglycan/LPS O-acetylase OafA/YrhL
MGSTGSGRQGFSYRRDVDGLRAVAVLSVVLCHAGLGLPGGFVGVDVFFVISGYLITGLILKDLRAETFSLADFWERRVRRIVPALLTVTAVTLVAGWFLLMPEAYASLGKSVAGLTLLISNVQFWRDTDYFAAAAREKPLLHTWSLAVEEQFYLLVPLALLLLARGRLLKRGWPLLTLAMMASFGLSVYGMRGHADATFYLLPTRAWELFAGCLLAFLPAARPGRPALRKELLAGAGLALILVPCFLYDEKTPFPGLGALPPVVGTALLIWVGRDASARLPLVNRGLARNPFVFVGLISYSLYLWHWPLFAFAWSASVQPPSLGHRVLLVVAGLALAVVSWRYVELPFRNRKLVITRPRLVGATGLAFLSLLAAGVTVYCGDGVAGRLPSEARHFASFFQKDLRYNRSLEAEDVPGNLLHFGNANAPAEILVWGDSHAMSLLPAIESLCRETGVAACAATHRSTAPVTGWFNRSKFGMQERALPFNAAVLDYARAGGIRKVVLAAYWNTYFPDPEFPAALLRTVDALRAAGVETYFVKDVPTYGFNVPKALALYSLHGRDPHALALPVTEYEAANPFHASFLPGLKERGVVILDPVPVLQARTASTDDILPFDASGSFYRDEQHLGTYGALAVKPLFSPVFTDARSQRPAGAGADLRYAGRGAKAFAPAPGPARAGLSQ